MQHQKTIFISGANRGIGLSLAGKCLAMGHHVYAAARHPDGARELWELERDFSKERLKIIELDVTRPGDLQRVGAELKGQTIDVLVNNAGVLPDAGASFTHTSAEALLKGLTVNSIGPLLLTQTLLPNLQKSASPVVATVSSKMGSITDNTSGGSYAYRMSKAAVNMFNKSFALDFPGITAVVLHPGWVQTDMGGAAAPLTVEVSTSGLAQVILGLTPKSSGKFLDYQGREIPW